MSSFVRALGAVSFLALAAAPAVAQGTSAAMPKFAYVNSSAIMNAAPGRAPIDSQFQKELAVLQDSAKKMNDALLASFAEFQKVQATLTQAQKDARTKTLQERQAEAQTRSNEMEQQAQRREQELMQPLLDQIKMVLEDIRVEGGYTFIFDVAGGAGIVAADKNLDISDRVIAKLRTMPNPKIAAKSAVPAKPAGAPIAAPAGIKPPAAPTKKPSGE
ncbi:MAG: OmpH family outer membrane protein [Gemmatimonadetes bacterium]|nr:OmpH family outer membrane protein [Gemmatimonadota bacterium]MBI3566887.1 OmpH family outer membrane protein [Gemmatimonadota bacterium]